MTLADLADLIRANSANRSRRMEDLYRDSHGALLHLQNDMTDVRGEIRAVRPSLDLAETVSAMKRQIAALAAEAARLKRRA